jgi:ribose 5-phosphate isomerase A
MVQDLTQLKQQAAAAALKEVKDGMVMGLGSGSTTAIFIEMLGKLVQQGELTNIVAVPTSEQTAQRARELGIALTTLSEHPVLDLAVDGADEVDPSLNLIKGLGRALLREKVVEIHARRLVVIVDDTKMVPRLGTNVPLPVEILPFEAESHMHWLRTLAHRVEYDCDPDGKPVITDNGNFLAHCWFDVGGGIRDCYSLARLLADRPGILEHGLFLDMTSEVIVASPSGIRIEQKAST